ncbi:MAG: CusA/CzcA family heavy metal efflux RND transporter [Saprospiraceae bacterium]
MLNRIISFSLNNKLIIGLGTVFLIAYGFYQFLRLPIDAVPDITDNQVLVITAAPAYGATDIERLITFPIEQANTNIPGLVEIRSFSRFGLSLVTIIFDDATDVYWARQQVSERLAQVQAVLPPGMGRPELGPVSTGLGEIYQYVIRPLKGYEGKYDAMELRTIQDWIVRRQLLGVKGVAEVSSFGGNLKQYQIIVDVNKLQSFGLSINDVFESLEKNNQNTGGAYIEKGPTALFIRSEGLITSVSDIENISINKETNPVPIFIRDIAKIEIGHAIKYGAMYFNDVGEVAGAVVMMLKGANSSEVIIHVKSRIAEIQKTLPEGVIIEPFLDRSKMVNNAMATVQRNLIEGALIVIFVLVLFLGNLRAGLLVASVIPLALLFAVIMMNAFGVSGNLMSLGALDFGLIVDGAVIIVEAVMHSLYHSPNTESSRLLTQNKMDHEVKKSASKMMNSAVFGQIIILIVYLPIFTLQGIEGKMFKPMAQTVAFSLLGAFILSVTYIPMMSTLLLSKKIKAQPSLADRMMSKIESWYLYILSKALRIPRFLIAFAFLLFCLALYVLSRMGGEFIPELEEGDFAVETRVLTGSNINTTIDYAGKAAHIILSRFPEVEKVVTKIGAGEVPTDPMPMEASDMMIILKNKKEWTSARTFNELADKMSTALKDLPGISVGFQYPVQMRFNELMTGAKQDVVCKIFGEDLDTLSFYANLLNGIIKKVDGATDIYLEPVIGMPQIVIKYNRATIAQYSLDIEDINRTINMALAGQSAGQVFEGERRFDLVVKTSLSQSDQLGQIENLLIKTPNGIQMPLKNFASIDIVSGPNQIQREDAKRRIIVGFNVSKRDVQSIVQDLQSKVEQQMKLPPGYYIVYGGTFENINAAKKRLSIAVPVSLLLIFILLFFAFNSVRQSLLIYTAIPLSAIGGIFLLSLRDMPFSISAGIGFIALFGVAVLNGIVLIAEFNQLKKNENMNLQQIVIQGTKTRLRPVLMTAFVASLGFLPMALSAGAGAEVQRPLATVVIGGLLVATLLTLFILPILYIMFEKVKNRKPGAVISVFLFMILATAGNSQTKMKINTVVEMGLARNQSLENDQLISAYQQQMIKTVAGIPQTIFYAGYGEMNSSFKDNAFSISQGFNHPKFVKSYRHLLNEQWKSSAINVETTKTDLTKSIYETYFSLVYYQEKADLLTKMDSLLLVIENIQKKRFEQGDVNKLELNTTTSHRMQIKVKQMQLESEVQQARIQMQILLNSDVILVPDYQDPKMELDFKRVDSLALIHHPLLQFLRQKQNEGLAQTTLDEAQLLPEFSIGINSTTMKGSGSDDKYYDKWRRFNSVQVGLGIPILNNAKKEKIKASKMYQSVLENEVEVETIKLENQYEAAIAQYKKLNDIIFYYDHTALPNVDQIEKTSDEQYAKGEINVTQWIIINDQIFTTKLEYLDALNNLNQTIILINFLTSRI